MGFQECRLNSSQFGDAQHGIGHEREQGRSPASGESLPGSLFNNEIHAIKGDFGPLSRVAITSFGPAAYEGLTGQELTGGARFPPVVSQTGQWRGKTQICRHQSLP